MPGRIETNHAARPGRLVDRFVSAGTTSLRDPFELQGKGSLMAPTFSVYFLEHPMQTSPMPSSGFDWAAYYASQGYKNYIAHLNDPNAARNYLFADAGRRQPYADNMAAIFDHAEKHWQDDPKSNYNLAKHYGDEMREVFSAGDWDTIDPAFKKTLEANIARADNLRATILAAHPELEPEQPIRPAG